MTAKVYCKTVRRAPAAGQRVQCVRTRACGGDEYRLRLGVLGRQHHHVAAGTDTAARTARQRLEVVFGL